MTPGAVASPPVTRRQVSGVAEFARVGLRFHLVAGEPMYLGQPQVAMCGAIFIRQEEVPDGTPACYDCERRDVDRMRYEADRLLELANTKALSIRAADAEAGGGA